MLVEIEYFFSFKLTFSWVLVCMSIFLIEIWTFWVFVMKFCIFFKSSAVISIFWYYSGRTRWEHSSLLPCGSESPSSPWPPLSLSLQEEVGEPYYPWMGSSSGLLWGACFSLDGCESPGSLLCLLWHHWAGGRGKNFVVTLLSKQMGL